MPTKASERNYKKEYAKDQKKRSGYRNALNKARRARGLKKGDGKEIDHKKPVSKGGSNAASNLRVVSKKKNRSRKRK